MTALDSLDHSSITVVSIENFAGTVSGLDKVIGSIPSVTPDDGSLCCHVLVEEIAGLAVSVGCGRTGF